MRILNLITGILLLIGGLNWGLVGLANFDLVASIFGRDSGMARIIYGLVGISAGYQAVQLATGISNGDIDLS